MSSPGCPFLLEELAISNPIHQPIAQAMQHAVTSSNDNKQWQQEMTIKKWKHKKEEDTLGRLRRQRSGQSPKQIGYRHQTTPNQPRPQLHDCQDEVCFKSCRWLYRTLRGSGKIAHLIRTGGGRGTRAAHELVAITTELTKECNMKGFTSRVPLLLRLESLNIFPLALLDQAHLDLLGPLRNLLQRLRIKK